MRTKITKTNQTPQYPFFLHQHIQKTQCRQISLSLSLSPSVPVFWYQVKLKERTNHLVMGVEYIVLEEEKGEVFSR
jgi:hypothetical protein